MGKVTRGGEPRPNLQRRPLLIVLSGPSGVGKDAVLTRLKEANYPLRYVITMTTRARRVTERDNVDYRFVSLKKFEKMREDGELLEWANVYGNWYGVPKQAIKQALDMGEDTIVKIDVQGATSIKQIAPQAVFIFLMPPSMEELAMRLRQRYTETPADITRRLKKAEEEKKQLSLFDYVVVNRWGKIGQAVAEIEAIITAEKCRVSPRKVVLG
jgi:guanylate kinase